MKARRSYRCSICEKVVEYDDRMPDLYPFCSPRCRRVDLGRWFRDQYVIEREMTPEELEDVRDRLPPYE